MSETGTLILVATPIGNLADLSPRAQSAIQDADAVMAEDTRRTARFVADRRRLYSYHDHNARGRLPQIEEFLRNGHTVAVVSDAGMPGISDPAYRAVSLAVSIGAVVSAVPGPSAAVTALVISGLPTDRFAFEGFLPVKKGKRLKRLAEMKDYPGTLVYYTGPHHLVRTLEEIGEILGDRRCAVARELTKVHEEVLRGSVSKLLEEYSGTSPRGEITLLVEGTSR